MDSITHLVTGAAIGEAMLGRKIGRKAALWGAVAGSLPDIDVISGQFMNTVDELVYHRGFTHSIVFALIVSPMLGFALNRLYRHLSASAKEWGLMVFVNLMVHIALDCFTTWGTQIFWPHSYRVELKNIFVIDPVFTIPILVCVVWMLCYRNNARARRNIVAAGLIVGWGYMLFTFGNKLFINRKFEELLHKQEIPYSRYETKPTPLNNILWSVTAEVKDGYFIGFYSHFDSKPDTPYFYFSKNHHLLEPVIHDRDLQRLLFMTQGYYTVEETGSGFLVNDLRFGQMAGWQTGKGDFVFAYHVDLDRNGDVQITQRVNTFREGKEMLPSFLERIKGN